MMRDAPFSLLPCPKRFSLPGKTVLVLGLGDTGLSVARWVQQRGGTPRVADTRLNPPARAAFSGDLRTGVFTTSLLEGVDCVCISPGLALSQEIIVEARSRDIPVLGDVELFAWENKARVLAITGTNGKTTVTSLTGHLLRMAGVDVEVAGNIAPPVLDAAMKRSTPPAAWVLELSSYQLETTWSLDPHAAAMLNLSEDHLDRYAGLDEYGAAKARVFQGDGIQVLNRDDPRSMAMALPGRRVVTFGLQGDFNPGFIPAGALNLHGAHNVANALAAAALASSLGIAKEKIVEGLRTFRGLPHRVELVATRRGVEYYDDSKGTNVGATVAALRGLGRKTVLILGGDGKGQDFSPLREPVREFAKLVLLIGRDASLIEKALAGLPSERSSTLEEAVGRAAGIAKPGEAVLLSPACASFDMFRDYRHRGDVFAAAARKLPPATEGPSS